MERWLIMRIEAIKYLLLISLLYCGNSYAKREGRRETINAFAEKVDNYIVSGTRSAEQLDSLIRKLSAINWNLYYDLYGCSGPVVELKTYCQKENLASGVIACANSLGVMCRYQGLSSEAISFHNQALTMAESARDTVAMVITLNNLGVCARRTDDLSNATNYHMQAMRLAESYSNQTYHVLKGRCIALNSLGNIHISLMQYPKAVELFKESILLERQLNSFEGQAINLANIGEAYNLSGQLDSAWHFYSQSLVFNEKAESLLGVALSNSDLGGVELKRGNYDNATDYYQKAIGLMRPIGDKFHLVVALEGAAEAWIAKGNYNEAQNLISESIQLAKEIHAKDLLREGYRMLSDLNQATGDFRLAYDNLTVSQLYSDSVLNEKNQRHLAELQARYEDDKKMQQIALLNKEQELSGQKLRAQRLLILGIGLFSLMVFVVILLIARQQKISSRNREIELGQRLLRSQMNPHFIFNSLGSIQNFMFRNDGKSAAYYLGNFSGLMRSVLEQSRKELITLADEAKTLENYLVLEKMRCNDMLQYSIVIAPETDPEEIMVPPMLVQPFVENAVKHAFPENHSDNRVQISFAPLGRRLEVCVVDNGIGIGCTKEKCNHNSMAIAIFDERLKLLGRKYWQQAEFEITDLSATGSNGTRVRFYLPLT